eukprot:178434_1
MTAPNDNNRRLSNDETLSALAIFQSAVYGNEQLILQQQTPTSQNVATTHVHLHQTDNGARDTDFEEDSEDDTQPDPPTQYQTNNSHDSKVDPEDDDDSSDTDDDGNPLRIHWAQADDDFKQQFFRTLLRRYEDDLNKKDDEDGKAAPMAVGDTVDLSLPHSKYPCHAEIVEILDGAEYRVKYVDPADKIEKETIVSGEFLRGADDHILTEETANKYEDQSAIENIFLEGIASFAQFEHLAVCIHPWTDKYFFKPYLPKGFMSFFMMTDAEISIDTRIPTRDASNEYDYVSKFLSLNILSFIGATDKQRKHKIGCIWCGVDDILMRKTRPRRRLLLGGVTYDRGVSVLCD